MLGQQRHAPAPGSGASFDLNAQATFQGFGVAYLLNVDPGTHVIHAKPQPEYGDVDVASYEVEVRSETMTFVNLYPSR